MVVDAFGPKVLDLCNCQRLGLLTAPRGRPANGGRTTCSASSSPTKIDYAFVSFGQRDVVCDFAILPPTAVAADGALGSRAPATDAVQQATRPRAMSTTAHRRRPAAPPDHCR